MPRKNAEIIFGSYFSECPFCSNGSKTDLHPALLKAMITSEDQKEKFGCALQNACLLIIGKAQAKRLRQSAVSETFPYGLLWPSLTFFRDVPVIFGEAMS